MQRESKTAIFVVGFDEKLVIRSGFRIGLQPGDTALLVYSLSSGEYERSKVLNAVNLVKGVLSSAGISTRELVLEARSFGEDVSSVVKVLGELSPRVLVVSLGSGMRYLGVVVLYAALLYREALSDAEVYLHVAREDGLYDVLLSAETLRLSIGPSESKIVCLAHETPERDELVKKAVRALGRSQSTIYAILSRMQQRGLVELRDSTVVLTPLGEALALSLCGQVVGGERQDSSTEAVH